MNHKIEEPKVVYEDKDFIVLNKPAGLMVHAARIAGIPQEKRPEPTLVQWLLERYPELAKVGDDPALRPGVVHRLDKATSGIMVIARNQETFEYLKALFQKHEVQKTYLAVVAGIPKEKHGTIDAPIGIRNGTLKRSIHSEKMAKSAVTEYRVIKPLEDDGISLLAVYPKTGRTHQIRVHLASIGHPVVGDPLYGSKTQPQWVKRLMLHAIALEFPAAGGKQMRFEADPPGDFSYPHPFSGDISRMIQ